MTYLRLSCSACRWGCVASVGQADDAQADALAAYALAHRGHRGFKVTRYEERRLAADGPRVEPLTLF